MDLISKYSLTPVIVYNDTYQRWLKSLPLIKAKKEEDKYSKELAAQFQERLGILIESKDENKSSEVSIYSENPLSSSPFPTDSINEALAFFENNRITKDHTTDLQKVFVSITNWEQQKELLLQVTKSFRAGDDIGKWVDDIFEIGSDEWIYFNICLFVIVKDGWYRGLHHIKYLKRAYELDSVKAIKMLKEILGYFLSGEEYTGYVSCNLIKGLSEIQFEKTEVRDLLQTIYQIVKRRLPHSPDSKINMNLYQGLDGFSKDEMVVALLIARLKTLTTEKTQGILWSINYISQYSPKVLWKPFSWAFSNHTFLLPIHRALLLQIMIENVDQSLIPDTLIGHIFKNYPTGFFLEDQYIRSLLNYKVELDECPPKSIQFNAHKYDQGFFPYIHLKYRTLDSYLGPLDGTYKAYTYRRDEISKKYESYYMRVEELNTPIVPLANASYEIVNSQFYSQLKQLTYHFGESYICNLGFFITEIILQLSAFTRRPSNLPTPKHFPAFEINTISSPIKEEGWIILASNEKEISGEHLRPKKSYFSSSILTCCKEEPLPGSKFYSKYAFRANQYEKNEIHRARFDQPICSLNIVDMLEKLNLVYVSPYIIRELGLSMDSAFHKGFQAYSDKGEIIIKMVTWKEDYYGDVSDGNEVPRLEGVAVMIREDWYKKLLAIYKEDSWFVLSQNSAK